MHQEERDCCGPTARPDPGAEQIYLARHQTANVLEEPPVSAEFGNAEDAAARGGAGDSASDRPVLYPRRCRTALKTGVIRDTEHGDLEVVDVPAFRCVKKRIKRVHEELDLYSLAG